MVWVVSVLIGLAVAGALLWLFAGRRAGGLVIRLMLAVVVLAGLAAWSYGTGQIALTCGVAWIGVLLGRAVLWYRERRLLSALLLADSGSVSSGSEGVE